MLNLLNEFKKGQEKYTLNIDRLAIKHQRRQEIMLKKNKNLKYIFGTEK